MSVVHVADELYLLCRDEPERSETSATPAALPVPLSASETDVASVYCARVVVDTSIVAGTLGVRLCIAPPPVSAPATASSATTTDGDNDDDAGEEDDEDDDDVRQGPSRTAAVVGLGVAGSSSSSSSSGSGSSRSSGAANKAVVFRIDISDLQFTALAQPQAGGIDVSVLQSLPAHWACGSNSSSSGIEGGGRGGGISVTVKYREVDLDLSECAASARLPGSIAPSSLPSSSTLSPSLTPSFILETSPARGIALVGTLPSPLLDMPAKVLVVDLENGDEEEDEEDEEGEEGEDEEGAMETSTS